ncbi:MAG: tRNA (adenosine(37)-N6)-threonylcarbamoyltransferase complex transferase subunit TsaD [Clostridia bacterium]|nr:tRNA (adenosine(37)-N6)-threonylcarbamoyltransferase complex transferase subunit TsaD [Clostridia bacterium]
MEIYDLSDYKLKEQPVILALESSCDDTACAVVKGRKILADEVMSSAALMEKYGGVVPEIASRAHTDAVDEVTRRALNAANITAGDVDAVAATYGAGLLGSLLVGLSFAKALAYSLNVPFLAVNHIMGHVSSAYLEDPDLKPPFVTLLASGGHTAILHSTETGGLEVLAATSDDAVGEAFDKCARVLGLSYPGGPNVQRLAEGGRPVINFPSAEVRDKTKIRFSYSGLKTSVINYCHNAGQRGEEINGADVAASFTKAAIDPLVKRTVRYALDLGVGTVTCGGGVAANGYLRSEMKKACDAHGLKLILPEKKHCTDNAAMIAAEGYNMYVRREFSPMSQNAEAQIPLEGRGVC